MKDDRKPFFPVAIMAAVFAVVLAYAAGVTTFVLDQFRDAEAPQADARIAEPSERPSPPISAEPAATDSEHREPAVEAKPADPAAKPSWELGTKPDQSVEAHAEQADASAPAISVVWQHFLGRGRQNLVAASAIDSRGDIYVSGQFSGILEIPREDGVERYSSIGLDGFLIKLDPDGRVLWSKVLSEPGPDAVWDIAVLANDDVLFGGSKAPNAYLAHVSREGILKWERLLKGTAQSAIKALGVGLSGEIYCAGAIRGRTDMDPGPDEFLLVPTGTRDGFIARFQSAGQFKWAFRLGNYGKVGLPDLAVDRKGNVVVVGYYKGPLDVDPREGVQNVGSGTGTDAFIAKYDRSGNYLWSSSPASTGNEMALSLLTLDDRYFVGGYFTHSLTFGEGQSSLSLTTSGGGGDWDGFVVEYSADGFVLSAENQGTSVVERIFKLDKSESHGLVMGGTTGGIAAVGLLRSEQGLMALPNGKNSGRMPGRVHTISVAGSGVVAGGATVGWPYSTDGDLFVGRYRFSSD